MKGKLTLICILMSSMNLMNYSTALAQNIVNNLVLETNFSPNPMTLKGISGGEFKATEVVKIS